MAYRYSFQVVVEHPGLHKCRIIRGSDRRLVEAQAAAQRQAWNELYEKKLGVELQQRDRRLKQQALEDHQREAEERTREAQEHIEGLRNILKSALAHEYRVDWERLKNGRPFPKKQPLLLAYLGFPAEPKQTNPWYQPKLNLFDKLVESSGLKKRQAAEALFKKDFGNWEQQVAQINRTNQAIYEENARAIESWNTEQAEYESARVAQNQAIEQQRMDYLNLLPGAVVEYCDMVLSQSRYPEQFPQEFELDYSPQDKTLVVDYRLPSPDQMPRLKEVKFIRTRSSFTESYLSEREVERLYENALFQTCLRTVHEIFQADAAGAIDSVGFNGRVNAVSKSTGNLTDTYVMTLLVNREEFCAVNLVNVEPKHCFKALNGVAGKLGDVESVTPITRAEAENISSIDALQRTPEIFARLADRLNGPNDVVFVRVAELAGSIGFPATDRFSASESRQLAQAVRALGFGIEPDARYGAPSYRSEQELALFKPAETVVRSETYSAAAALLQLSMIVAAAGGHVNEAECKIIRETIDSNIRPTEQERQRLQMLQLLLARNPAMAHRALKRVAQRIPASQRMPIANVLVYIGGADGVLTTAKQYALEGIFDALELPTGTLDEIIRPLRTDFHETTIQQAVSGEPGEMIIAPKPAEKAFALDMTRVARISAETSEVIGILSQVMSDSDAPTMQGGEPAKGAEQPIPASNPVDLPVWMDGLPPDYREVLLHLVSRNAWPRPEFEQLAAKFHLMPLAVLDAINEWSDDKLGDFLLEGDDPIGVHVELIKAEAKA